MHKRANTKIQRVSMSIDRLCLVLERGLLQLLLNISHRVLLLRQFGIGRRGTVHTVLERGLLRIVGGAAAGLGGDLGLFLLQAGDLLLGLLDVLCIELANAKMEAGRGTMA
jgi:hypothetical protein